MNKIFATGLLCTLAVIPVSFSMDHNGAQDAARAVGRGEGPKFAFEMYSIPVMRDLCKLAQSCEQQTGINLGKKSNSGFRDRIMISEYLYHPENIVRLSQEDAKLYIFDFVSTFVTLYVALDNLAKEVGGQDFRGYNISKISQYPILQDLYNNIGNSGLQAFRDFLGNPRATFDDFKLTSSDAILWSASQDLTNTLLDSVNNVNKFLQSAENDYRLNAVLKK